MRVSICIRTRLTQLVACWEVWRFSAWSSSYRVELVTTVTVVTQAAPGMAEVARQIVAQNRPDWPLDIATVSVERILQDTSTQCQDCP
eukprot:6481364-Amphidinium_carterae.1